MTVFSYLFLPLPVRGLLQGRTVPPGKAHGGGR